MSFVFLGKNVFRGAVLLSNEFLKDSFHRGGHYYTIFGGILKTRVMAPLERRGNGPLGTAPPAVSPLSLKGARGWDPHLAGRTARNKMTGRPSFYFLDRLNA